MSTVVITPPEFALLSLDEAKAHLRVEHDDDNDYIESLIEVATSMVDGPAGWLGRALITQTLEWRGDEFPTCPSTDIRLLCPPVISVTSVKYDATAGEQTVAGSDYRIVGQPSMPAVSLYAGGSWPSSSVQGEAVRIRYVAGYGEDGEDVPAPIRHAILLLISQFYENRSASVEAAQTEFPFSVTALLSPYRIIVI